MTKGGQKTAGARPACYFIKADPACSDQEVAQQRFRLAPQLQSLANYMANCDLDKPNEPIIVMFMLLPPSVVRARLGAVSGSSSGSGGGVGVGGGRGRTAVPRAALTSASGPTPGPGTAAAHALAPTGAEGLSDEDHRKLKALRRQVEEVRDVANPRFVVLACLSAPWDWTIVLLRSYGRLRQALHRLYPAAPQLLADRRLHPRPSLAMVDDLTAPGETVQRLRAKLGVALRPFLEWMAEECEMEGADEEIPLVLVCADAHQLAQRFVLAPADADAGARADAEAGTPDAPEPGKTAAAPPSPEQQPSPELPGAEAAAAAAAPSFSGPPGPSPTSAAAVEEHSAGDAGGLLPPLQQPEQPEQTQPHSPGVAAAAAGSLERLPDLHPRPRGPPGAAAAAPSTTSSSSSGGGGPFGPSLEHLPDAELQRTLLARDRLYEAVRCGRPRLLVLCSWAQPADWVFVLVRGYAKLLAGIGDVCPNRAVYTWQQRPALLSPSASPTTIDYCYSSSCSRRGVQQAVRYCTNCQVAKYCSANCQAQHWAAGHCRMCKRLAAGRLRDRHTAPQPSPPKQQQDLSPPKQQQQRRRSPARAGGLGDSVGPGVGHSHTRG